MEVRKTLHSSRWHGIQGHSPVHSCDFYLENRAQTYHTLPLWPFMYSFFMQLSVQPFSGLTGDPSRRALVGLLALSEPPASAFMGPGQKRRRRQKCRRPKHRRGHPRKCVRNRLVWERWYPGTQPCPNECQYQRQKAPAPTKSTCQLPLSSRKDRKKFCKKKNTLNCIRKKKSTRWKADS